MGDEIRKRRKGTALVETDKGILVVSREGKSFILPGGGAHAHEDREKAARRELMEETGLKAVKSHYLFSIDGGLWKDSHGKSVRNLHKVFLIKAQGKPRPDEHEVRYIDYWKKGSKMELSKTTQLIIDRYLKEFK